MAVRDPGRDHVRNPLEWAADQLEAASLAVTRAGHSLLAPEAGRSAPRPGLRRA